jgi:orotidine-5'-phosphate decarboxylase
MDERVIDRLCSDDYERARKMTYVVLDYPNWDKAAELVDALGACVDGYKVGLQLFHADGERALSELKRLNKRVFLDMKLHDIPNTVYGALQAICSRHQIEMVNVHALGGGRMMRAARQAVNEFAPAKRPLLIAVTILTSLGDEDLAELGLPAAHATVRRLAEEAAQCGMDGVVASALDIETIRQVTPSGFEIVVPGTRPVGVSNHDQSRSLTPEAAAALGASRLVIGRAVTQSNNPKAMLERIWNDILGLHMEA